MMTDVVSSTVRTIIALISAIVSLYFVVAGMCTMALVTCYTGKGNGNDNSRIIELLFVPSGLIMATPYFFYMIPALLITVLGVLGLPQTWQAELNCEIMEPSKEIQHQLATILQCNYTDIPFYKCVGVYLYKILIPGIPVPATVKPTTMREFMMNREPCKYYKPLPEQEIKNQYPRELWLYVNGIMTSLAKANETRKSLYQLFNRPIHLLHNPTDGIVLDLLECIGGKTGLFLYGSSEPRKVLKETLVELLQNTNYDKIVLIAHSQGTIITGNVLADLGNVRNDDDPLSTPEIRTLMKHKLEIYALANAAHIMPGSNKVVAHLESISNRCDTVAWLGQCFPVPLLWLDRTYMNPIQITSSSHPDLTGRIVQNYAWGHFLECHYFEGMRNQGWYSKSKLVQEYLVPKKQKNQQQQDVRAVQGQSIQEEHQQDKKEK